jgi:hypothetical protein
MGVCSKSKGWYNIEGKSDQALRSQCRRPKNMAAIRTMARLVMTVMTPTMEMSAEGRPRRAARKVGRSTESGSQVLLLQ